MLLSSKRLGSRPHVYKFLCKSDMNRSARVGTDVFDKPARALWKQTPSHAAGTLLTPFLCFLVRSEL